MIKKLLTFLLICTSIVTSGQNGITFEVEKLPKPEKLLSVSSYDDIYKYLILKNINANIEDIEDNGKKFPYHILAKSKAPDSLVYYGYHSFFNGMYDAYANHRPFVLSPDMIWLLISQGFARHVIANSEKLRAHFVGFSGKQSLIVKSKENLLDNPNYEWEKLFPQFTDQIKEYAGEELINTLTSDFSTTTQLEKTVSEITIMEAMEPYFEFVVIYSVCGIPEITLQGTPEDWQKIVDKTKKLNKFGLKWWTKELEPILGEFVKASKGEVDKTFWRNMFKYHSQKEYGAPNIIDGWIVKFFPYDRDGRRNDLKKLIGSESLPDEIVKVDLKYIEQIGDSTEEIMLELWGGFVGLEQNPTTFSLTPKIGWMVKKKDVGKEGLIQKLEADNIQSLRSSDGISMKIKEVPESLKNLKEIFTLTLYFEKEVFIPEWLKDTRIGKLNIKGNISRKETAKIINWFPNTDLKINNRDYNTGKNGWIFVSGFIPEKVLEMDSIWILEISHMEKENNLEIPDRIKNVKIDHLTIVNNTSKETIDKIKRLLPNTKLYVRGERIR